jgi:hypothetical protein
MPIRMTTCLCIIRVLTLMFVAVELSQRLWSCDSRDVYDSDVASKTNPLDRSSELHRLLAMSQRFSHQP